jgi:hypothetical protein
MRNENISTNEYTSYKNTETKIGIIDKKFIHWIKTSLILNKFDSQTFPFCVFTSILIKYSLKSTTRLFMVYTNQIFPPS